MFPQTTVPDEVFHCFVGIIDALGNIILYEHSIPYDTDFNGFLEQLSMDPFHSLLRIGDDADYVSWAKRLQFLSSDKDAIAKLDLLIEQHKTTDYEKLAEWLWIRGDGDSGGEFITGETEFNAFMALARSKKLSKGCLMRVAESKFSYITKRLTYLEVNEDREGLIKCEEAFVEMERRQKTQGQASQIENNAQPVELLTSSTPTRAN